jgi:prefoldin beta subunit
MDKAQLEKLTKDYQNVQMQMQSLALQKIQFSQQKEEFTDAQKELEKASGKMYMEIGGLILETTKEEAQNNLKEKLESTEMRLTIINKQYDEITKKEQSLRATLTEELKKNQKQ